jgi:hypothetical protein
MARSDKPGVAGGVYHVIRTVWLLLCLLAAGLLPGEATAQMLNARRLGMGGVATSDNAAARSANIAFRAVPKGHGYGSVPLPIGLLQYASDPPTFDSDDPDFNIFEILNLVSNPPLTLSLSRPDEVSGDISIFVARDSLLIDLEDVRRVVPDESMKSGSVYHLMGPAVGIGSFFVQVQPIVHVRNEFDLDDRLRAALRDAEPFVSDTRYGLSDEGVAQAAVALQAGFAVRAVYTPAAGEDDAETTEGHETGNAEADDPRRNRATALYLGGAPKLLLGMAYGQVQGAGGFTTGDTLFGNGDPVSFDMAAATRSAAIGGAGGMGHGLGADVGAVLFWNNFELGVGVNDFGSEIHWQTNVRTHVYNDALNEFVTTELADEEDFTSRIPAAITVNVAKRFGPTTVAADVVDTELRTMIHVGAETWMGTLALRGGAFRDTNGRWQLTGGTGFRFGNIGLDLALATNSRNIEEARAAELCASLTLY